MTKEEIQHQIPHFIFPIAGLFITTIPRLLLLLCNHRNIFKKVINEIYSVNNSTSEEINKLTYLRKCILETLRLNNPVITTFRTLTKDYKFDNKYSFKKGDQFLILNNPVLREKEYFKKPNEFIPSRWTLKMEKSYYAISFNQDLSSWNVSENSQSGMFYECNIKEEFKPVPSKELVEHLKLLDLNDDGDY